VRIGARDEPGAERVPEAAREGPGEAARVAVAENADQLADVS